MSLLVQRPDVSEFRGRFRWLTLFAIACFIAIAGRAFQLQLIHSEDYQSIARENIVRKITLATTRGIIRDRDGKVLAASRPAYNMFVVPNRITYIDEQTRQPRMSVEWEKLVALINMNDAERQRLEERMLGLRRRGGKRLLQQILLKEDVSRDIVAVLKTHGRELRGIAVVPVSVRYYPQKSVGAHLLGYMREVDRDMLMKLRKQGYVEGDRLGATGLERAWESYLRGTRGWKKVIVDARGARRSGEGIIEEPRKVDAIPGRDLRLTIDASIQSAIVKAMRGELAGGAVLVNVKNGEILGMVSKPSWDPNHLSGGSGKQVIRDAFKRLFSDPLKPALDKTLSGAYPPGSTFKPFTALAALEKGLTDSHIQVNCRGFIRFGRRIFRCTQSHGLTQLHKAIAESCNVYFYRMVSDYGVTMDMIADIGMRYGLGKKTGIGVNAESSGRMPTRAWMTMRNKGQFRQGFTLNAALGQGATTVTVLQLALAYAALANGGTLYQPKLVQAVETANGEVVQEFAPRVRRKVGLNKAHWRMLDRALWSGVNEAGGTSYKARLAGVDVAGKTGSAQVSHRRSKHDDLDNVWYFNRDHAWFAGFAPTNEPEVAVVVLIEHGGAGGKHAAPVAFEIIQAYQRIREQRRTKAATRKKQP